MTEGDEAKGVLLDAHAGITIVKTVWEAVPKRLKDRLGEKAWEKWQQFKWTEAEHTYRLRIIDQLGTTRLLGNPKPIRIDKTFTDVYVLPKPSARRRYERHHIQGLTYRDLRDKVRDERVPALDAVRSQLRLYVLGKPGAGKTTFLKYLAISAARGEIKKTPIFVPLKEWADSRLTLMSFLEKLFDVCAFPDAKPVIEMLLDEGKALVLFDGLDEVTQVGRVRHERIRQIVDFSNKYYNSQVCVTCRTAAEDFSFDHFTYVEIADFEPEQQIEFIKKWYGNETKKLTKYLEQWSKPSNEKLRELAETPLLLALLCLAFDETLEFPRRKVDLYKESIDALLKRWDSSRSIFRDSTYKNLSISRKEQLLSRIAAETFQDGKYLFQEADVAKIVAGFLKQLPPAEVESYLEPEAAVRAIEAQHGLLIERAMGIFSFSHLTFHEYFVAQYIVDNSGKGTVSNLVTTDNIGDARWREVFLLTASMLDNADYFFDCFATCITQVLRDNRELVQFFEWVAQQSSTGKIKSPRQAPAIFLRGPPSDLQQANEVVVDLDVLVHAHFDRIAPEPGEFENSAVRQTRTLLSVVRDRNVQHFLRESRRRTEAFARYIRSAGLYRECLAFAAVSNRQDYENKLFI